MSGQERWQWKHGLSFVSDLYHSEEFALKAAVRATTGGSDDGIAVRRVVVDEWREVGIGGYKDEEVANDTGFEKGDVVKHDEGFYGLVTGINRDQLLLVSLFGEAEPYFWSPSQCTLVERKDS